MGSLGTLGLLFTMSPFVPIDDALKFWALAIGGTLCLVWFVVALRKSRRTVGNQA